MNIFELFGTIAINNDSANKSIDATSKKASNLSKTMKASFEKIGKFAVKAGTVIGTGLSAGMGVLLKNTYSQYADYEQLLGGVKKLFGDSWQQVSQYANEAYKNQGMSANEYMSTVTSFSASLVNSLNGDTAAAAEMANMAIQDMADNANTFGTDISMLQNAYQGFAKQNYTMLDNLKLGYGGNQEEMARLINDSGVLGSAMKVTAETVNDVSFDVIISAINTIQRRMEITGTTAKEAGDTIAGSFASFKAAWSNLLVGLANEEDIEPLVDMFFDAGETVWKNIKKVAPKIMSNLSDAFSKAGQKVKHFWSTNVWTSIQGFAEAKFGITLPSWLEVEAQVVTWWTGIKTGVQDLCSWTLKLFEAPNEAAIDAGKAIETWWTETALPGILSVSKWTLGLFGMPVEDEATVKEHVSAWWATAGGWVAGACEWTLKLFGVPTEDIETIKTTVGGWWEGVKSAAESVLVWALGDPSMPDKQGVVEDVRQWWTDTLIMLGGGVVLPVNPKNVITKEEFDKLTPEQQQLQLQAGVGVEGVTYSEGDPVVNLNNPYRDQSDTGHWLTNIITGLDALFGGGSVYEPKTTPSESIQMPTTEEIIDGLTNGTFQDPMGGFGVPSSNNELQTTIQNWTNTFDANVIAETIATKVSEAITSAMGGITITTGNVTLNDGALVGRILPQINLGLGQLTMQRARGNA